MSARSVWFGVAPVVLAAGVGGLGARDAPQTYARRRKPAWAPPAAAFGPVWTALYVMIGAAGVRVASRGSRPTRLLHLVQLALNAAWPVAFFGRNEKRTSLAVIAGLDAVVLAEIIRLRTEDPAAAALLLPYLGWTVFATALNAAVEAP